MCLKLLGGYIFVYVFSYLLRWNFQLLSLRLLFNNNTQISDDPGRKEFKGVQNLLEIRFFKTQSKCFNFLLNCTRQQLLGKNSIQFRIGFEILIKPNAYLRSIVLLNRKNKPLVNKNSPDNSMEKFPCNADHR